MGRIWTCPRIPDRSWNKHMVRYWVLACFDPRFRMKVEGFLERLLRLHPADYDLQLFPGGAKTLAEWDTNFIPAILHSLETSRSAHSVSGAILMTHEACAAYGRKFSGFEEELEFHSRELRKAYRNLKQKFPDMSIKLFFIGRGNIYEIDP